MWLGPYWLLIGFVTLLLLGTVLILTRGRRALPLRIASVVLLGLETLLAVNFGTLTGHTDARERRVPVPLETACRALDETLIARTGSTPLHSAQPINLVLIGIEQPDAVLEKQGWLRNRTFAGESLGAWEVTWLTPRGRLPPRRSCSRAPPRTWLGRSSAGRCRTQFRLRLVAVPQGAAPVHLGSVVQVDTVTLPLADRVPTPARDLCPATDKARNQEVGLIASAPGTSLACVGPGEPVPPSLPVCGEDPFEAHPVAMANEFFSDGQAAKVRARGAPPLGELCGTGTRD